mgnify:FL=1
MKRKFISVLLSISMCLTMVSPAGATSFSSEKETDAAVMAAGEESGFDAGSVQEETTEDVSDIFSAGEEEVPDSNAGEDGFQDTVVQEKPAEQEEFLPGVMEEEIPQAEAGEAILVDAQDWEKDGEHFKLRRKVSTVQKQAAVSAQEEIPVDAVEDGEAAFLSGEEIPAADNAEGMEAGEVLDTEAAPQPEMPDGTEEIPDAEPQEQPQAEDNSQTGDNSQTEEVPPAQTTSGYYTEADGILCISTEYKNTVHNGY